MSRRLDGTPISRCGSEMPGLPSKKPRRRPGPGTGKQAKIVGPEDFPRVLAWVRENERVPEAAVLKMALSLYAGLRACEISRLRMWDVTTADREIASLIHIRRGNSKNGRERWVPMDPIIADALEAFRRRFPNVDHLAVCKPNGRHQKENALTRWFFEVYKKMGLEGCSSHTGRRSFATHTTRQVNVVGLSIRDVQEWLGHARLDTTQRYIQPSENLRKLSTLLPAPDFRFASSEAVR
jgi:integrase/recombinase XerD